MKNKDINIFKIVNKKKSEKKSKSQKNLSILNLGWIAKLRKNRKKNADQPIFIKKEFQAEEMIENANIHRRANRPLKKIKEYDGLTKFCQCCYNAMKDDVHTTDFKFCDSTDEYAQFGRATSLYFFYIKYSIIILLFSFFAISLINISFNKSYTEQIFKICKKIYSKDNNSTNNFTFPLCNGFININENSIIHNSQIILLLKFNSMNIKQYRNIYLNITNGNDNIDKVLLDYNFLHFISLITLFITHSIYTILLFNINKQYDMSVSSPSDYSVIITNLHSTFDKFLIQYRNGLNEFERSNGQKQNIKKNNLVLNKSEEESSRNYLEQSKELKLDNLYKKSEVKNINRFDEFLKNEINEKEKGEKYNIFLINICYKINKFIKVKNSIEKKIQELYIANNDPEQILKNNNLNLSERERKYFYYPFDIFDLYICPFTLYERSKKISEIEREKKKLEDKQKTLIKTEIVKKDNFSGAAFLIFNSMKEKDTFLEKNTKNIFNKIIDIISNLKYYICCCCINPSKSKELCLNSDMIIEAAPEPEDVIFENLEFSRIKRISRIIFVYIISFIIIAVCFFFILYLNNFQIKSNNGKNNIAARYGISLSISLIIAIINSIFQNLLVFLTKLEKQICMTNFYLSYSIKLTILTFLTSTIIPYLSSDYYEENLNHDILITNCLTMFLSNSFLIPITWTINFELVLKKLRKYIIKKKKKRLPQNELNNLYELLDMDISSKYSYITRTLLMAFFYTPIFPLGIPICCLGFIFIFFLEKYNFIKMYKKPIMLNSRIYEVYSNYFVFNLFMLTMGDYVFLKDVFHSKFWTLFNIILFGILLIFPYNHLLSIDLIRINEADLKVNELYEDSFYNFFNDYERNNPITKNEGIKHFLDKLLEKVLISKNDYDTILQNYEHMNLLEIYYKAKFNLGFNLLKRAFSTSFLKKKVDKKQEIISYYKKSSLIRKNVLNLVFNNETPKLNLKDSENTNAKEEQTKPSELNINKKNVSNNSSLSIKIDFKNKKQKLNNNDNDNNNDIKIVRRKKNKFKTNIFNNIRTKKIILRKDLNNLNKSNKNTKRELISKRNTIENEEKIES